MTNSLHKINKMYETLNEIVEEQGETLNRMEDNFRSTRQNTKGTVEELKKTLMREKNLKERIMSCDFSVMCLGVWFIVAFVFFTLDLILASLKID